MNKIGDLMTSLGKYNDSQTGEEKTRWGRVGTVFEREDHSMVVKLDLVPLGGSGWLSVFTEQTKRVSHDADRNLPLPAPGAGQTSAPPRTEAPSRGARPDPRAQRSNVDFDEDIPF